MTGYCSYCAPLEHIDQTCKSVYKHEHQGYPPRTYPCDKPWSAVCQTEHGDLCFCTDAATFPEAMGSLCDHLRRGGCIKPGDGDRAPIVACAMEHAA